MSTEKVFYIKGLVKEIKPTVTQHTKHGDVEKQLIVVDRQVSVNPTLKRENVTVSLEGPLIDQVSTVLEPNHPIEISAHDISQKPDAHIYVAEQVMYENVRYPIQPPPETLPEA